MGDENKATVTESDKANAGGIDPNLAGGDKDKGTGGEELAQLKSQIEALTKKNQEILGEKKKTQEELETLSKKIQSQTVEDAEKSGDYKKALELTRTELSNIKSEQAKFEADRKAKEEADKAEDAKEIAKIVKEKMIETFKNALPGKLVNEKLLLHVNWDKHFVRDPDYKDGIKFIDSGVKMAVEEFQLELGEVAFVKGDVSLPTATKATGGAKGSGDSIKDMIKKHNLA